MAGLVGGWFAANWLRGMVVSAGALAIAGMGAWTATPLPQNGLLVDAGGRPVAGAAVTVPGTLLSAPAMATSDARGRYRVGAQRWPYRPLVAGVAAPGFAPALTGGGRTVLHRWPRVSGLVVDDAGAPVAGAVVTVSVAGAVVAAAMTGLDGRFQAIVEARSGGGVVTALSDQHDPGEQAVALGLDRTPAVQLTLPRQFATLHVTSDPAGQVPQVDGTAAADCPGTPCDVRVLAGSHTVAFGGDLYVPWQTDVQVDKGQTAAVSATLQRKTGTLTVTAPGAGELSVDGQGVPGTSWSGVVPTGQHPVAFRSAGTWPFLQQAAVTWQQTTQVALTPTAVSTDPGAFTSGLRAYLGAQGGGTYGVYMEDLAGGDTMGVGDTTSMEAASVIKVPEAITLLHQVDGGRVGLDDQVTLQSGDFMGGTGVLYGSAHPGDTYSYRQLLTVLIQQSDNTAWLALRRMLGDAAIDAYSATLGAGDCSQVTDDCSARSAGHLMAQLARGRLLSAGSTQLLMGLLETTVFNDRINYYLGGVAIAHKVGMDGSVWNDCGIVLQAHPFAVCVFTTVGDPSQGIQVIRDVARAAAWHYAHE